MSIIEIYTDGACRGNPGPGGWGVLLRYGDHEQTLSGAEYDTTNNRMELTAAIKGLSAVSRSSEIKLVTDSEYVKNGMTKWLENWRKRNWKTASGKPVKNKDLWEQLDQVVQKHKVHWFWVKGHSGHPENEQVDDLATSAIDTLL